MSGRGHEKGRDREIERETKKNFIVKERDKDTNRERNRNKRRKRARGKE